jgi:hypothetical protein
MRERHYSPQLSRLVVCALYHEAKAQRKPMTRLADEMLTDALDGTIGMKAALSQHTRRTDTAKIGRSTHSIDLPIVERFL